MARQNLRTFYTIILSQTLSLIGSRISGLALGIWIFNDTGNVTPLALIAFFGMIPNIVVQGFAGVLADRWDRRYVMAISDAGQAFGTVILLVLFLSGQFVLWHLYVIVFIQSVFGVFQGPAFTASVTMLIPDEHRDRANAIMQMTGPAAGIIAPVIAGLVFGFIGVVGAIAIDMLTFVIAMTAILLVKIPRPKRTKAGEALAGSIWQEMLGGLRYMWQHQGLFKIMMCAMVLNFILNLSGILLTPYLLERTGSEALYGIVLGIFNAGAIAGAVFISVWGGTRPRIYTIIGSVMVMGIMIIFAAMAQSFIWLSLTCFFILFPNMMANVSLQSIMQAKVAPDVQGRVFATIGQIAGLLTPLAYLLAGPLADQLVVPLVDHPQWTVLVPFFGEGAAAGYGLIYAVSGSIAAGIAFMMLFVPSIRNVEADMPDYVPEPELDDTLTSPELVTAS